MNIAEQIKYFKKISRKEATIEELKEYLTAIIQANFSDPKDCPVITFEPDREETGGTYNVETKVININPCQLEKIINGDMKLFADMISTCGHELTHYFQYETDYIDHIKKYDKDFCEKMKSELDKSNDMSPFAEAFTEACDSNIFSYQIILDYVYDIPHLKQYLHDNLATQFKKDIGHSYYLQLSYEEDARLGGLSFLESILKEYKNHLMRHPDEEVWEYLSIYQEFLNVKKDNFEYIKKTYYPAFDKFKKVFTDFSNTQILEISKIVLDGTNSSSMTTQELKSKAFYNLLLDTYIEFQIEESNPVERQILFMTALHHYFITDMKEDKNKFDHANLYGAKVLQQLVKSDRIPKEEKQSFGTTIYKHFIENYGNKHFDKKDNFITFLYMNYAVDGKQMDKMIKGLIKDDRIFEACNILHFDDLNNNILYSDKDIPDISKCVEIRFDLLSKHIFKILKEGSEDDEFFKEALSQLSDIYSNSTVCYLKVHDKKAKEKMEFIRNKSDSIRNKVQEEYFAFEEKNRFKIEGPLPDKLSY